MRIKDPQKEAALCEATVRLVNDIGFAEASVAKIAKAAGVSPATLYTYFKSKDDLLVSTYQAIMRRMAASYFAGLDEESSIKERLRTVWKNMYAYISSNRADYLFEEQFSKSPYMQHIGLEEHKSFFAPLAAVIRQGVERNILKKSHFHMHMLFFYYPVLTLANPNGCHAVRLEDAVIEAAFEFAWDAIRA